MTPRRRRKTRNPPGQGGIFQRRDGRYVAKLVVGGVPRIRYANDKATAEAYLAQLRADARTDVPPDALQTTAELLTRWLRSVRESVKPRTYENYDLNVRRLSPLLGAHVLRSLEPGHVGDAERRLLERKPKPLSRRSVQQAHVVLHTALAWAVDQGWLPRNPCDSVKAPKPVRAEMLTLTEAQLTTLFQATAGDALGALWVLIGTTGLRLGEALGLRWQDVDWDSGRITIRRQVQRQAGRGIVVAEPKRGRSRRTVHVPAGTLAALREHRRRQAETRLHELVYCHADGTPLDPSTIRPRLHQATLAAGLPDVTVHGLRHTLATVLLARGTHPKVVQEMLGHSTIAITLDLYSHVAPTLHRDAAEQLDSLFGDRKVHDKLSNTETAE